MHFTANHRFPKVVEENVVSTIDSSISKEGSSVSDQSSTFVSSVSENIASITKLPSVPEKALKMKVDKGEEEDNLMVDPDSNGLEFLGAYMAELNTDDAVWMAAVSDPSHFNT